MRVLLYDVESARYFNSSGWTCDLALAHDFGRTAQAVNVAYQQKLKAAEIVLAFDDVHMPNMRLPLNIDTADQAPGIAQSAF